jgi:hypothetical protein
MNALSGLGVMAGVAAFWAYVADMIYVLEQEKRRKAADR